MRLRPQAAVDGWRRRASRAYLKGHAQGSSSRIRWSEGGPRGAASGVLRAGGTELLSAGDGRDDHERGSPVHTHRLVPLTASNGLLTPTEAPQRRARSGALAGGWLTLGLGRGSTRP